MWTTIDACHRQSSAKSIDFFAGLVVSLALHLSEEDNVIQRWSEKNGRRTTSLDDSF